MRMAHEDNLNPGMVKSQCSPAPGLAWCSQVLNAVLFGAARVEMATSETRALGRSTIPSIEACHLSTAVHVIPASSYVESSQKP